MKYNTRIAPSPTGMFHLGTARTAYFNYLAARATGGRFILRIDDTDLNRNDDAAVDVIYDSLDWLGLDYDYDFHQSSVKSTYKAAADMLLANDLAYRDGDAVRLRIPSNLPDTWSDLLNSKPRPITDADKKLIDGLVLIKSDGMPTYNLASVVDDLVCDINLVIRGTDHVANTPKQIAIICALKLAGVSYADIPEYAHVGLIMKDKKKLSKRDGAASLLDYRDAGYHPDAMLNFMLRLGWSPSDPKWGDTLIDRDVAKAMFWTDGSMRAAPANMDLDVLKKYDRRYKALSSRV